MKALFYTNDPVATKLFREKYSFTPNILLTEDIDYYKNYHEADVKIAYCNERFIGKIRENRKIARELKPISNFVIFELGEMMTTEVIDNTIDDNIYYLIPGFSNSHDDKHFIFLPNFFIEMKHFYVNNLSWVLDDLDPYSTKQYYFDALLGTKKAHRDLIYNSIVNFNLQERILLNYTATRENPLTQNADYFWEPGTTDNETVSYSGHVVNFHNLKMPASSVLPVHSVYNKSCYSIVAETAYEPQAPVFFTEKIVKPILARRLFIVFSAKNFLKRLKQIGFKTFDNVIDETYDSIDNDEQRWTAAFEQVASLCLQDQQTILEKIKPIVDHNHFVLTNTDWRNRADKELFNLIESTVNSCYYKPWM
jgi:hypothetical protein